MIFVESGCRRLDVNSVLGGLCPREFEAGLKIVSENDTLRRGTINDVETNDFIVVRMNQFRISTVVVYKNLP